MKKNLYLLLLFAIYNCEAVFEEDLLNGSVTILAPQNNVQLDSGNIKFSWQILDAADSYQLQIATPNFQDASQILLDSIINTNQLINLLDKGNYEWRIRAMNSTYQTPYNTIPFIVN